MNKNIKLINILLITGFLVACNNQLDNSSLNTSISSSAQTVGLFEPVTAITISTPTNLLEQNINELSTLAIRLETNPNIDPNLRFEWYVDGVKSFQDGKIFEYLPNRVGTYNIQARYGSIASNQLRLIINDDSRINITSLRMSNGSSIEVIAEKGLEFSVKDNQLTNQSNYNIKEGKYYLFLDKPVAQGTTLQVTARKQNFPELIKDVIFDTRIIIQTNATIDFVDVVANSSGVYTFEKPNNVLASGLRTQASNEKVFRLRFKTDNLDGIDVPYSIEHYIAPIGVNLFPIQRGNLNIVKGNAGNLEFIFRNNINTIVGNYRFRVNINGRVNEVSVNVIEPSPKLSFVKYRLYDNELEEDVDYDISIRSGAKNNPTSLVGRIGVERIKDVYTIEKDFLEYNFKQLEFRLNASNFKVAENFLDNTTFNPNQIILSLSTPDQLGFIRTTNDLPQLSLPAPQMFRGFSTSDILIQQRIDASTPVGTYAFTFRGLENNVDIINLTVIINVVAPKAKISPLINLDDSSNTLVNNLSTPLQPLEVNNLYFIIQKPTSLDFETINVSIDLLVENFESSIQLGGDLNNTYLGKDQSNSRNVIRDLINYRQSISGPSTFSAANIVNTKIALEAGRNLSSSQLNEYSSVIDGTRLVNNRATLPSELKNYQLIRTNSSDNQNKIVMPSTFNFDLNYLTLPGTYVFRVELGTLVGEFTIKIEENVNKLDFSIDTTGDQVSYDQTKDVYNAILNKDGEVSLNFNLDMYNANFTRNNQISYRFVRTSPEIGAELIASSSSFENVSGNDGHVRFANILSIIKRNQPSLTLSEVGEYSLDLTVDSSKKLIKINVLEYPSLEITSLTLNNTKTIKYYDNNYVSESIDTPIAANIILKPTNLTNSLYYRIFAGNPDFSNKISVDDELLFDEDGLIELSLTLNSYISVQPISIMIYKKPSKNIENYEVIGHKTFIINFLNLVP